MIAMTPAKGYDFNPLKKSELRNVSCICGSKKKTKVCCGAPDYIPKDYAVLFKLALKGDKEAVNTQLTLMGKPTIS